MNHSFQADRGLSAKRYRPMAINMLVVMATLLLLHKGPQAVAQALPEPSEEHEILKHEVGSWDAVVSMWMAPDAPPTKSTGKETNTMLGEFWLLSDYEGDFQGAPFIGRSQLGYGPAKGEYVSTWIDSMAPSLFVSRGPYDAATQTMTLTGEGIDWMTGEPKQVRQVITFVDDDHKRFEIHEAAIGSDDWQKTMEIEYTRSK